MTSTQRVFDSEHGYRDMTDAELAQAQIDADEHNARQIALEKTQYQRDRAAAYPSLGDQLDALWHAMDTNSVPRVPAFYDPIAQIKAKFPKP